VLSPPSRVPRRPAWLGESCCRARNIERSRSNHPSDSGGAACQRHLLSALPELSAGATDSAFLADSELGVALIRTCQGAWRVSLDRTGRALLVS
jgi:hypothetical protein